MFLILLQFTKKEGFVPQTAAVYVNDGELTRLARACSPCATAPVCFAKFRIG